MRTTINSESTAKEHRLGTDCNRRLCGDGGGGGGGGAQISLTGPNIALDFAVVVGEFNSKFALDHKEYSAFSLKSEFVLANSADPDEIPQFICFHWLT